MTTATNTPVTNDPRELITPKEFAAVAATVQRNNRTSGMTMEHAEAITADALAFVAACAAAPTAWLRPSRIVDEGWHALMLHTITYRDLCARLGRFVHHIPEPPDTGRHDPAELARTQTAIRAAGYQPDPTLWLAPDDPNGLTVTADCEHGPTSPGCRYLLRRRPELTQPPRRVKPVSVPSWTGTNGAEVVS